MSSTLLVPGQPITAEAGFLRGHGTYIAEQGQHEDGTPVSVLTASVAGEIERVNRLISVKSLNSRYIGEVGDLIVGRIAVVDSKRWRVDISGQKEAGLQLSSVTLPGGAQRIQIQNISSDGVIALHTRSLKYGKLENGQLVVVPSNLIKRLPQHYVPLPCGMDVILGKNGYVWISRTIPAQWKREEGDYDEVTPLAESLEKLKARHNKTPYTKEERMTAARLNNAIRALATARLAVTPDNIMAVFQRSLDFQLPVKDMLLVEIVEKLTERISR